MKARPESPSCPFGPARRGARGSVVLVALCIVTVLGIALASYIAVCSRAMQLSNRTFQNDLSRQLAEMGLEEALRAFNANDWSGWSATGITVTWDTTTYASDKRAIGRITLASSKLGQGVTATIKLRVDNYDAAVLGAAWYYTTKYKIGDLVGRNGIWYRCVQDNYNQTPNGISTLGYWVPEPFSWTWNSTTVYKQGDMVNYGGEWYRYSSSTSTSGNVPSTSSSYWTWTRNIYGSFSGSTYYYTNDLLYYSPYKTWIMCTSSGWGSGSSWNFSPTLSWRWINTAATTYSFNDCVYQDGVWYRYINATPTSGSSVALSNPSYWENALSGSTCGWTSGTNYNIGNNVYYSSTAQWYRCIRAHPSSGSLTPANTTYWANTPAHSMLWATGEYYSTNDLVSYHGVWYLCRSNHTSSTSILPTNTSYWIGADTTNGSYVWNASTNYSAGTYITYGNVWYLCTTTGNKGKAPNDAGYWTATWSQSWQQSSERTGAPVVYAEATITLGDNTTTRTQLRAALAPAPLFPNAVAATGTLRTTAGGTVDSYDSTADTYASQTNTATNYSAVVASTYAAGTAITLSGTTVKGYLAAPSGTSTPYAPLYSTGGSVKGSTSPVSPNIDLTQVSRSPSIPQFDSLPRGGLAANWSAVPKGTALGLSSTTSIGTPGATTPSRYYYDGNLTIGSSSVQYLNINGPVILYINGDFTITSSGSSGRVTLASTGSAEIHVAGAFKADSAGEGILSQTTDPKSLIIICDSSSASHYYSEGVNALYGVIYAAGTCTNTNNNANIYGAVSAGSVNYTANLNVHYDTSLRYATFGGVDQPYAVSEWRELPAGEQATLP